MRSMIVGEQGFSRIFWQRSRRTGKVISSQTMHIDDKTNVVVDKIKGTTDRRPEWMLDVKKPYSGESQKIYSRDVPNTITSRIQNLEFQLSSTLGLLRSGKDAVHVNKASYLTFSILSCLKSIIMASAPIAYSAFTFIAVYI